MLRISVLLFLLGFTAVSASAQSLTVTLDTPAESVIYYADDDVYLVSNFGSGGPVTIDNDGFISRVDPETGKVKELKWIEGTLSAPKGMAIVDDVLYVADVDALESYDLGTGASLESIEFDPAAVTFPNDVCVDGNGRVYLTDTGLKPDFSSSGTDAIYVVEHGMIMPVVQGAGVLKGPNGCWGMENGLLAVTFGGNEVLRISGGGEVEVAATLPNGGLDGIVAGAEGYYVTSWEAGSVFHVELDENETEVAVEEAPSPADLAYDAKRARVIVPLLQLQQGPPFTLAVHPIAD